MSQPAGLIAERFAVWGDVPRIVGEVFGTTDPAAIAEALDRFCQRELGSGIDRAEFFEASVGSVHGLRLLDDRRIVVKLHGPRAKPSFLTAVQEVQRRLFKDGLAAPEPLLAPTAFGQGTAVVEALLDRGEHADAHNPVVREVMAGELARLIGCCRHLVALAGLCDHLMVVAAGRLWPAPHDARFEFEATAAGAEWIDKFGWAARAVLHRVDRGDWIVGHSDWRVEHLRFEDAKLTAIYDWDSIIVEREPVLVGGAAHGFTADFAVQGPRQQRPTLAESMAFIDDYEAARAQPFSTPERQLAHASLVYSMAYAARCEHSDGLLMSWGERQASSNSARAFLAAHAADLLGNSH